MNQIKLTRRPLMIAIDDRYNIIYVSWGPPPPNFFTGLYTLITGPLADQLYLALAGHAYGEHPSLADPARALAARRELTRITLIGARITRLALIRWGHKIKPWLGITKLDDNYWPILDAPEYNQVIPLTIPDDAPVEMKFVTVPQLK